MGVTLTLELRQHLGTVVEALSRQFTGVFSRETIKGYVDDTLERWPNPKITAHIPVLVERFARDRLRALAQAEGLIAKDVPEVLFVCEHNAGRSQMAAALLDHFADGRVHVRSAGSIPAEEIHAGVIGAMAEVGIDLEKEFPKPLTDEVVRAADVVVTMGCGDACPVYPGKRYMDWELADPAGRGTRDVDPIRHEIERRVRALLDELLADRPRP
jgi:protein-tyrosine-phosphatase